MSEEKQPDANDSSPKEHLKPPKNRTFVIGLIVLLIIVLYSALAMMLFYKYEDFFYDFQSLIGGLLAVAAALITTGFFMWKHFADERQNLIKSAELLLAFVVDWNYRLAELDKELDNLKKMTISAIIMHRFADNGFTSALKLAAAVGGPTISVLLHQKSKIAATPATYDALLDYMNKKAGSKDKKNNDIDYGEKVDKTRETIKNNIAKMMQSNLAIAAHLNRIVTDRKVPEFTYLQIKCFYPKIKIPEGEEYKKPPFTAVMVTATLEDDIQGR